MKDENELRKDEFKEEALRSYKKRKYANSIVEQKKSDLPRSI